MTFNFSIRIAERDDLPSIVKLLADDALGKQRECYCDPLPQTYFDAFNEIAQDKNNYLIVVEEGDSIIGTLQLTIITYLTYQGKKRAQIEGVRINESYRGKGLGKQMIVWAIDKAREVGCHLVQLTSDKTRLHALEFYQRLGFVASHEGLKLKL